MKKLLSLPPNLVESFHDITHLDHNEWFCTHDPVGHKLGSGGGTTWLLLQAYRDATGQDAVNPTNFQRWLQSDRRLLLHAGGQSRRLPSYAPSGKILTPIPVFRWERGQRLSQNLLSLQVPLYERIMKAAPERLHTMVVSGDVLIRATEPLQPIPDADVVCYGLWLGPEIAKDHGVFVSHRETPAVLDFMLQKPSVKTLGELLKDYYFLTDIGVWLLSDKAVNVLMQRSMRNGEVTEYDLYGTFGCCLGEHPSQPDPLVASLKVAVLPLPGGEFYHFGTSHELLSSTLAIQNLVNDQRRIMHHSLKPCPSIFVQNAHTAIKFTDDNENVWVENSCVGPHWTLTKNNIVTGVPDNDWTVTLHENECLDIVPIGEKGWVVRRYGYFDKFAGEEQTTPRFPLFSDQASLDQYMRGQGDNHTELMSAEQISDRANLRRLEKQRELFRNNNWVALQENHSHSVFYQLDLEDAAQAFNESHLPLPSPLSDDAPLMQRIGDAMMRSRLKANPDAPTDERKAFHLLAEGITAQATKHKVRPHKMVCDDQIVWGRSPVRIDIAGGWTDTPPYCILEGGNVVNLAIELNGQPPIQTYVKPCRDYHVVIRSIDLGVSETVTTFDELADFNHVGSAFSIPKAALVLCGFHPDFCTDRFPTLEAQLRDFGCGIEITLLSAIPAGSGLGTSSVLAANVLGTLNDFLGCGWDKTEIGNRTLVLEQLLTTGGGWQDQFGGLLQGVKLLQTEPGWNQSPQVRWLPDELFTRPEYRECHLLYYTGITRTAKKILADIVRRMFLNEHNQLELLREMKGHALEMYDAIQRNDFEGMGRLIRKTWEQNQQLDSGTNPPEVAALTREIDDLCWGYKLPGAGGGGYLYMVAKDPEAAVRIRQILSAHPLNPRARFVDMALSKEGMVVSRS
ncbi:MAG: bifunctional fucokinase/fucose-1-phosphate guanylyltransferase [Prevotella sp.]|jgi:galactokinase/mevalonate kinase-like predicted kinase